jgi:diguanylate cyclase
MSNEIESGTPHAAMAAHLKVSVAREAAQRNFADPVLAQLRQAISEVEELRQALATSQRQAKAARQQIETLAEGNARLSEKLLRLAEKVEQARHFAYHDELTGLPNRSLLRDRCNQATVQAARQHKQVALLLLDLDGFKSVNDRLGHAAGDRVLRQVAERLIACIRGADTACRYGGDEFVIMLPEFDGGERAATVAETIRVHLAAPYAIGAGAITVTASIGIAIYPEDGENYDDLIQYADAAMYRAKDRVGAPPNSLHPAMRS